MPRGDEGQRHPAGAAPYAASTLFQFVTYQPAIYPQAACTLTATS